MASNECYIDNSSGEIIDPAIAGNQVDIDNNLVQNSSGGGTEVLTLSSNVAVGANQACRSAMFWTMEADMHFAWGTGAADTNDPLLVASTVYPVPVQNTNLLSFFGTTDSKKVYIIYRN